MKHAKNCILFLEPDKIKKWVKVYKVIDLNPHLCQYCLRMITAENADKKEEK